jgi:hypothetical protein
VLDVVDASASMEEVGTALAKVIRRVSGRDGQ